MVLMIALGAACASAGRALAAEQEEAARNEAVYNPPDEPNAMIKKTIKKKKSARKVKKGAQSGELKQEEIEVTFIELGSENFEPCKMMRPVLADIEKEYGTRVKVIFYDVLNEDNKAYAREYEIRVIPTQVFLDKDGKEFFRHEGYFPREEIVKVLEKQGVK